MKRISEDQEPLTRNKRCKTDLLIVKREKALLPLYCLLALFVLSTFENLHITSKLVPWQYCRVVEAAQSGGCFLFLISKIPPANSTPYSGKQMAKSGNILKFPRVIRQINLWLLLLPDFLPPLFFLSYKSLKIIPNFQRDASNNFKFGSRKLI